MKNSIAAAAVSLIATVGAAQAAVITYNLPYIGAAGIGNGFRTVFNSGGEVNAFSMDNAHSYFQQDISGLAGQTVTHASLLFNIGGGLSPQQVSVTSFTSSGTLGSYFNPPDVLASQDYTVDGSSNFVANDLDVTNLLVPRVATSAQYFALHFAPVNNINSLYVQPSGAQNLRLVVTTDDSTHVPEPSALALVTLALAGLALLQRRRTA